jgi:hypothetical protein
MSPSSIVTPRRQSIPTGRHGGPRRSGAAWRSGSPCVRDEGCQSTRSAVTRQAADERRAIEAAAKQTGWTIERDGALIVVRDLWTENEDHAAWLVATKVGLPLGSVTVWARRET